MVLLVCATYVLGTWPLPLTQTDISHNFFNHISSSKQAYWALATRTVHLPVSAASFVGVYNGFLNALTSALLVYTSSRTPFTSQTLGWKQYLGIGLFAAGIALEIIPEETRKSFKAKPENKGKLDNTGLWRLVARHSYL